MRVTGGAARGRALAGPKSGQDFLRPTCDRAREALFNILGDRVRGAVVLDLFAGTGALGIEALSRGAQAALFVDASPTAEALVAENLRRVLRDAPDARAGFLRLRLDGDDLAGLSRKTAPQRFDLILMDPPYRKNLAVQTLAALVRTDIPAENAVIVCEEHSRERLPERVGDYELFDRRAYGESGLWLYRNPAPNPATGA